jgi:acetyltransferase-like isoleucine patch superfamily enzyme
MVRGMGWEDLVEAARQGRGVLRFARPARRALREVRLPVVRPIVAVLYALTQIWRIVWHFVTNFFYREPLFRYRCARVGRRLYLEGPQPLFLGNGRIDVGDDVHVGSPCTWEVAAGAELIIGNRVSVNYRNVIGVARSVRIGDDTLIAGDVVIFDNTNHPVAPARRLAGEDVTGAEIAPIVIGRNVWIGLHSIIMRGVTIGDNSVIAAGSVVTKSVPPNTLVAGNPAVPIKQLID